MSNVDCLNNMFTVFYYNFQLIEESEERFDEDQMNELLEVVSSTLPPEPDSDSKAPSEADDEES